MDDHSSRRAFLAAMAAIAPLPGWAQAEQLCPGDPMVSSLSSPLTIDTHAHVFNGSDLQIREFLSQTTVGPGSELYPLVKAMTGVLQVLGWHLAPSSETERAAISRYATQLGECSGADQMRRVARASFDTGYVIGRRELRTAAQSLRQTSAGAAVLSASVPGESAPLADAIDDLPESFEAFEDRVANPTSVLGTNPTFLGYLQFVLHHFNLRHVNAIGYLKTYSRGSARKVDLLVASMVDYDYWLARGRPTPTTLQDQVDLMKRMAVLLGGRMHGFVPFCPFREVITRKGAPIGDSMKLVRSAIESNGFIGVKLYPPMGFAAWGNTGKTVWAGKASLLPEASDPGFGEQLDSAMASLFTYCIENDVPIMAHTNHSNGPYEEFRQLAGSAYWDLALRKFPGLSVNFGHFGDTDPEDHNGDRTRPFLKLMTRGAASPGRNTYADSGYFAGALMNQVKLRNILRNLYAADNGVMLERLMYGTDWTMILPQKNVERYLSDFMDVMRRVEEAVPGIGARNASLADAFFGRNAMEFLGLRKGRGNRRRLDAFYASNNVPTPDWMRKVDVI